MEEKIVTEKFQVSNKEKVCQACLYKIMRYVEDTKRDDTRKRERKNQQCTNNAQTQGNERHSRQEIRRSRNEHGGRPKKGYSEGSASTKRRMKSKAKNLLNELVEKFDEISKGEGQELLQDVYEKVPTENKKSDKKFVEVVDGLSEAYTKEPPGPAGRTRILSTVANTFSNKEFNCNDYEIMKARRQANEYGPGVTPPTSKKFVTKYKVPFEDLMFVLNFIHHPNNTVPSSHRMASCDGKKSSWVSELFGGGKQPVLWLKDGKHHLYEKYKSECSKQSCKPISETKFMAGLSAGNFKEMVEMAGLCNICNEVGARNFENLDTLLENIEDESSLSQEAINDDIVNDNYFGNSDLPFAPTMCDLPPHQDDTHQVNPLPVDSPIMILQIQPGLSNTSLSKVQKLKKRAKIFKGHLLWDFQHSLTATSDSPCHCMTWLLEENADCKSHAELCNTCFERYLLFHDINALVNGSSLPESRKAHYAKQLDRIKTKAQTYIAHLVRGKYQKLQFVKAINESSPGHAIAVCDYMMKLLMQKFREPQKDWYAKKGVSVHGCMFFYRSDTSSDIKIEIHDLFSSGDCTQNWYFSASALEATFKNFAALHPNISKVSLWSDNGPHYHNTSLILWLTSLHEICPMTLQKYSFFEAQKGKTALDAHFATFKFVLKGWMKRGNDVQNSQDITNGTQDDLKGTHVYEIQINRKLEPRSAKTWAGITGYSDFIYRYKNKVCVFIEVREQTNLLQSSKKNETREAIEVVAFISSVRLHNNRSHVNV